MPSVVDEGEAYLGARALPYARGWSVIVGARVSNPEPHRRVRVVAPSSPFDRERLSRGVARLTERGFVVDAPEDLVTGGHPYLAASDDERAARLANALTSDVDIVWLARGGYGLTRIVDRLLDVPLVERAPLVVGFSDATALLAVLFARGVPCVHGPLATTVADESEASLDHLVSLIDGGRGALGDHPLEVVDARGLTRVEGRAFAANLTVLTHLVGTRALPPLDDTVLFLEDVGERPYRIDRMCTQLMASGALDGVRAIVLGAFSGCEEPPSSSSRPPLSSREVLAERARACGVPLFAGFPFGHVSPNFAVPIGRRLRISVDGHGARASLVDEATA